MADGALTVKFDEYTARKLADAAQTSGLTPEKIVETLVANQLFDYDDFIWPEGGDPRTAVPEPIVESELRDWEEVRPELEAHLEAKLKARR
jgi:hypothetical protein